VYPRAYKGISSRLIARVVIRWKCRERTRHVKVPTRKSVHVLKTWVNVQTKKKRFFGLFITSHAKLKKDDNVCHSRPYPERNSLKTKRLDVNFSKEPPDRAVRPGATQNRQNRKPSVSANCLVRYLQHMEQFHSISHMVGPRCDVMFECSQNSPRMWPHSPENSPECETCQKNILKH
jgi:hypothetical protein